MAPLIHWDFSGKSNADAGTIVEDLTGNGYDLELKNFAFDNVSGYNGYPTDFRKWRHSIGNFYSTTIIPKVYENKLIIKGTLQDGTAVAINTGLLKEFQTNSCVIKVSGLPSNRYGRFYNYSSIASPSYIILHNGINIVDTSFNETASSKQCFLGYYGGTIGDVLDITFEIFPLYPDQLVFNDNYANTVKQVKINLDRGFTVIFRRKIIKDDIRTIVVGQEGIPGGSGSDFYIRDYNSAGTNWSYYTFGVSGTIAAPTGDLMWSTLRKFFNGQVKELLEPTSDSPNNNPLLLGTYGDNVGFGNFSIKEVYVFDRDLTQSQIEKFISDNMIPLPEVYYDVAKQGTLNEYTTKDKLIDFSGNENHGTLHNFTFDESNGWGYYPLNTVPCDERAAGNTVVINGNSTGVIVYNHRLDINAENFTQDVVIPEFRVKVTGLSAIKETQPNARIGFTDVFINDGGVNTSHYYSTKETAAGIREDGIYTVLSHTVQFSNKQDITSLVRLCDLYFIDIVNDGSVNITVEFLPTDEDCLRFKGAKNTTGTYIDSIYDTGFKTIFLLIDNDDTADRGYFYDQRKNESEGNYHFGLYYGSINYIAYNYRNSGITYIDGIINTTINSATLQGKRCITIVDDAVDNTNSQSPVINGQMHHDFTSNIKLYKFLGFKEALSEKQIKMVIEKYGLQVD